MCLSETARFKRHVHIAADGRLPEKESRHTIDDMEVMESVMTEMLVLELLPQRMASGCVDNSW